MAGFADLFQFPDLCGLPEESWFQAVNQTEIEMKHLRILLVAFGLSPWMVIGQGIDAAPVKDLDYTATDIFLKRNVSESGHVNYAAIKENLDQLTEILKYLTERLPKPEWTKEESLAYWINVYNLSVIHMVAENYPIKSLANLNNGKPWDENRVNIMGKLISLNRVEQDVLWKGFQDPRIYFALHCGTASCPPLRNEAFKPHKVQEQLTEQTQAFIRSKANSISAKKIKLSPIFEWHQDHFGNLIDFINQYATVQVSPDAKVIFKKHDWSLNDQ